MNHQSENNKKLNTFFSEEYHALNSYVNSRLKASVNRDAEDIIQDVALKLFSRADRYSPINNVAGFVYHAIKNKIIDVMRATSKTPPYPIEDIDFKLNVFAELLYDTESQAYSEEMHRELKKAILGLKTDYRNIIIAVDFEGYNYREISEETGIPVGTLMSRRHRAISQLYKTLKSKKETFN
ncbi:RNA polymerase sigma factor [Hyunsoonleella rubra]|uniref:RNA polymerase sigma factor n=1 Tax=Hyunsoonleella rubra TaxID=1737062 RepID=A0ABW5TD27_9FLAO